MPGVMPERYATWPPATTARLHPGVPCGAERAPTLRRLTAAGPGPVGQASSLQPSTPSTGTPLRPRAARRSNGGGRGGRRLGRMLRRRPSQSPLSGTRSPGSVASRSVAADDTLNTQYIGPYGSEGRDSAQHYVVERFNRIVGVRGHGGNHVDVKVHPVCTQAMCAGAGHAGAGHAGAGAGRPPRHSPSGTPQRRISPPLMPLSSPRCRRCASPAWRSPSCRATDRPSQRLWPRRSHRPAGHAADAVHPGLGE